LFLAIGSAVRQWRIALTLLMARQLLPDSLEK